MKRFFVTAAALLAALSLDAQTSDKEVKTPYEFTAVKDIPATSVKDQYSSGTCWSFAGIAFLESELLRTGKGEYDLSEMWIARHAYLDKARKYARMHGKAEFSQGGATHDVFNMIREYGIVPDEVYTGLQYGTDNHQHSEVEAVLKCYMKGVVANPNGKLTPAWADGLDGILDAYFGEVPETFVYNGKEYTPQSFAAELGLNMDDYVSFTSFTHHPFYTRFAVEIPDNWAWEPAANVPVDDLIRIIDTALAQGYAVNWSADVSEKGFRYNEGFAIVPVDKPEQVAESDMAHWTGLTKEQLAKMSRRITGPMPEKTITQEMRQEAFDNYETTDDHGMVIVGTAHDQWGNKFYKVKNSWGETGKYKGFFYVSEPYVRYKTMNIMVNRAAVPEEIAGRFDRL